MSDPIPAHDSFAKDLLGDPEAAVEVMRLTLSPEVLALLDLGHLERVQGSWVDEDLRQHFSDIMYRVGLIGPAAPQPVYLYILIEHKSSPDPLVAMQLQRYMGQHWRVHLKEEGLPLPVVIPLVLYHGSARWTVPTQFAAMFGEVSPVLRKYVPQFEYALLNLPLLDPSQLGGNTRVKVGLELLWAIFRSDLAELFPEILKHLNSLSTNEAAAIEYLESIVRYVSTSLEGEEIKHALTTAFPQQSSPIMVSFAQEYIEKGRQQGLEQGLERGLFQGREEGLERGRTDLLSRQIVHKFGESVAAELSVSLQSLTTNELDRLAEDILDLSSAEEIRAWFSNRSR